MPATPQLAFFIGKGGVGKTTASSAYAAHWAGAHPRRRVLLISTDPAHSLADVLQLRFGDSPLRVPAAGQLFAWQINPEKQFAKFLRGNRKSILEVVEQGTLFSQAEIAPLLDTTLPGMAEVAALLALQDLLESAEYHHIVVDTAPMGHTLRLFELPEHFRRFLDFLQTAASRDRVLAATFGTTAGPGEHPFLARWRQMVAEVQSALSRQNARLVLVTTPETFSLNQAARAATLLARTNPELDITDVVLNRTVASAGQCAACAERARLTRAARPFLKRKFKGATLHTAPYTGFPILGAAALRAFGAAVFAGGRMLAKIASPDVPETKFSRARWPLLPAPLNFTLGKGGVGKTTISAALGAAHLQRDTAARVTVCSTDPAPSLDDVFQREVGAAPAPVAFRGRLSAMEVDSVAEYRQWADAMRLRLDQAFGGSTSGGVHVDLSFDRRVLQALLDIVPPGVDEIFSIFRILDLGAPELGPSGKGGHGWVIDMAPTGHALELLRMPDRLLAWSRLLLKALAAHRRLAVAQEIAVEVAGVGQRVRELAERMRDPQASSVSVVMLAEPLPSEETARLARALQELGVPATRIFINRVIFKQDVRGCARCRSAREWQLASLAQIRRRHQAAELFVVRNFAREIAGETGLRAFTRELWQIE